MNGRRGQESSLGGGLASDSFQKEVTQAKSESREHLKWRVHSRHSGQEKESLLRSLKWQSGQGLCCLWGVRCEMRGSPCWH